MAMRAATLRELQIKLAITPSHSILHHWANDLHDAGYQPRRMKFLQEFNGYVFKTKTSHLNGGHRLWSGMERDGLRHALAI